MNQTFDPKTMTITTSIGTLVENTQTFDEWYARRFVCQHLHYKGELHNKVLTNHEDDHCWTLADGFGPGWTLEDIQERLEYDWSHIRDSSAKAMEEIANYILRRHYAGQPTIQQEAAKWLASCKAAGLNPINPSEKMIF